MDCVLVTLLYSSEVHICFCGGMNSLVRFACLGYKAFFFTTDDEFFIKTKITLFANVAMGFTFYNNLFNGAALLRPTLYERILS